MVNGLTDFPRVYLRTDDFVMISKSRDIFGSVVSKPPSKSIIDRRVLILFGKKHQ